MTQSPRSYPARVRINNVRYYLGTYVDEEKAAEIVEHFRVQGIGLDEEERQGLADRFLREANSRQATVRMQIHRLEDRLNEVLNDRATATLTARIDALANRVAAIEKAVNAPQTHIGADA